MPILSGSHFKFSRKCNHMHEFIYMYDLLCIVILLMKRTGDDHDGDDNGDDDHDGDDNGDDDNDGDDHDGDDNDNGGDGFYLKHLQGASFE